MTSSPSIWPALTAFAAVIALIPIALWLLKRLQGHRTGGARSVTVTGGLSLGPRERLVIVETQGRRWMLGVTAQSISLIAELDPDSTASTTLSSVDAAAQNSPLDGAKADTQRPFGELLDRIKRHD